MNIIWKILTTFCITGIITSCDVGELYDSLEARKYYSGEYNVENILLPPINVNSFECGKFDTKPVIKLQDLKFDTFDYLHDKKPHLLSIEAFELNERLSGIYHIINIPNAFSDKVWNPHKSYISKIDNHFNEYLTLCPGWPHELEIPKHSNKIYLGLLIEGRRYVFIEGRGGSVGPEESQLTSKENRKLYQKRLQYLNWNIHDAGSSHFWAVFDVESGAFIWIEYDGFA